MAPGRGKPVVNALILADAVYRDGDSGKFVIAGTFNRVHLTSFPAVHVSSSIYMNLSDFSGAHKLSMRFVRLSDGRELGKSSPVKIEQKDRLRHTEVNVRLPPLKFDHPGRYAVEVLWDGDYLGACEVEAAKAGKK